MYLAVTWFSFVIMASTYAYTFKEDFTPELLEKMIAVVVVVSILIVLLCIII